ncbi:hypothetical protein G5B88_01005 [Herbaspirillum seropedicae]|uniref:gp53-like domain-containing protein n=1 Tax=Herbaspirillum seropedicae TaxID=964 RepID=UPI0006527699|nr:phage tail protein [Herbaspirillum seropedicae]UMU19843.1 hypothetical protein G5B88_01005 [Herbaspirillum seropedicae]
MSIVFQFKLTVAGQAALFNANHTGTSLNLTHIQFGSGNRTPTGAETALLNPQQLAPIASGLTVSPTQIRMSAIFGGEQYYVIREVGLWAGSPGSTGAVLVAYWSQATGDLAVKSPGVDFVFSHDMSIDSAVPGGNLTIVADTAQAPLLALLAEHERKPDPHPQYVLARRLNTWTSAGNAPAFTLSPEPPVAAYATGQRCRVRFHSAGRGADTLNINGLGARNLKQYTASGSKTAAIVAADQVSEVEYDGADFIVLQPLPGGLEHGAVTVISGSGALGAAHAGKLLILRGVGGTLTLPAAASLAAGATLHLCSQEGAWSIARQATGDTINAAQSSVATLGLARGETLMLVGDGVSTWTAAGGSALAALSGSFQASKTGNGYQKLPGGLILQWGSVSGYQLTGAGGGSSWSGSVPMTFPNACLSVTLSAGEVMGSIETLEHIYAANGWTASTLTVALQRTYGSSAGTGDIFNVRYIAIGY